jgi:hypothetical protein
MGLVLLIRAQRNQCGPLAFQFFYQVSTQQPYAVGEQEASADTEYVGDLVLE